MAILVQSIKHQNCWFCHLRFFQAFVWLGSLSSRTIYRPHILKRCKYKTMLPGVLLFGFFNLSNGIFWVFYKKFDWIIFKIWSLMLFIFYLSVSQGAHGRLKREIGKSSKKRLSNQINQTIVKLKEKNLLALAFARGNLQVRI